MSIACIQDIFALPKPKGAKRLLLLAIADNADDNGVAWPSMATLAQKCATSERHLGRYVKDLVAGGHLAVLRQQGHSNTYVVMVAVKNHDDFLLSIAGVAKRAKESTQYVLEHIELPPSFTHTATPDNIVAPDKTVGGSSENGTKNAVTPDKIVTPPPTKLSPRTINEPSGDRPDGDQHSNPSHDLKKPTHSGFEFKTGDGKELHQGDVVFYTTNVAGVASVEEARVVGFTKARVRIKTEDGAARTVKASSLSHERPAPKRTTGPIASVIAHRAFKIPDGAPLHPSTAVMVGQAAKALKIQFDLEDTEENAQKVSDAFSWWTHSKKLAAPTKPDGMTRMFGDFTEFLSKVNWEATESPPTLEDRMKNAQMLIDRLARMQHEHNQ